MRIRTIKPEFWTNEKMAALPVFARLAAIALMSYADDEGFFWANPVMVRGAVFPFEDDSSNVRRALAELSSEGYLRLGKSQDGREIGHIVHFLNHQKIDHPQESKIKPLAIFDERSANSQRTFGEGSRLDRNREQGKEQGTGNGASAQPPASHERPQDLVFNALCQIEGSNPKEIGSRGGEIAKAKKLIVEVMPAIEPAELAAEIVSRAENYRREWPKLTLTASALAKHWAKFGAKPEVPTKPAATGFFGNDLKQYDPKPQTPTRHLSAGEFAAQCEAERTAKGAT